MIRGLYGAATALNAAFENQDVIAQNIASATVPGYRRLAASYEPFDRVLDQARPGDPVGARVASYYTDFRPGLTSHTGNAFDVALQGDGFFVARGPDGPVYTRDGAFTLGQDGQLQLRGGLVVLGTNGPLTIPPGATDVHFASDGTVTADGAAVGQLQLASFADPSRLVRAGTTCFTAPAGVEAGTSAATLRQGFREASNVNVATEMVSMIRGSRYFEAAQRVLRTLSDSVQLNTRPQ